MYNYNNGYLHVCIHYLQCNSMYFLKIMFRLKYDNQSYGVILFRIILLIRTCYDLVQTIIYRNRVNCIVNFLFYS